jgi:hypothetical protein
VVDKYNALSLSVIKCIKTYIQMINPKGREDWLHIEASLLAIAKNTHLSDQLNLAIPNSYEDYKKDMQFDDQVLRVDMNMLANRMVVQKSIVELLPNHLECLEEVTTLQQEIISFNDNLYLRCLLWRRGLGAHDRTSPPNLLTLEEVISGKLVAIYNSAKEDEIVPFSLTYFKKYCETSQLH